MQCCYWYQCYHLWAGGGGGDPVEFFLDDILNMNIHPKYLLEITKNARHNTTQRCCWWFTHTFLNIYQQWYISGELWRKWMQNTIFSSFIQAHTSVLELKYVAELIRDVFTYLTIFFMRALSILNFCTTGAANTLRNGWGLCRKAHWFGKCFFFFWSVNFMVMWLGAGSRGRFLKGGTVQGTLEDEWMAGRFQRSQYPIAKLLTYCSTTDCTTFITLKKGCKNIVCFF